MTDLINRELLEAELKDCRAQRDQANQQLANAQQVANVASTNIVRCNGGEAQLLALIAMLDAEDAKAKAEVAKPKEGPKNA